jgi:hypothetical protein
MGYQTGGAQNYAGAQGMQQIGGLKLTSTGAGTFYYEAMLSFTVGAVATGCQFGVQHTGSGVSMDGQIAGGASRTVWVNGRQTTLLSGAGCQALGASSGVTCTAILGGQVIAGGDGDFCIVATKITDSTLAVNPGSWVRLQKVA